MSIRSLPYTYTGDALSVFLYGVPHIVDNSHPNFIKIFELLVNGVNGDEAAAEIESLISIKTTIEKAVEGQNFGKVTVGNDCVLYNGNPINSYLTERMLQILSVGLNIAPWALFMDKLYKNPSKTAVDELFLWLDQSGMPITDQGNFLAYKKVNDDYSSFHRGPHGLVVMNVPGTVVEMPRNEVDDVRDRTCSSGLHFCSWQYLPHYYGSKGKVLIVEIDPADVVSIPSDYGNAKGRASKYTVIGEIDQSRTQHAFANTVVFDDEFDW